jgi:hypothetical protein
MNLPGLGKYDPSLPQVLKVRNCDGPIAANVVTFVDDSCPWGPRSKDICRIAQASQGLPRRVSYWRTFRGLCCR